MPFEIEWTDADPADLGLRAATDDTDTYAEAFNGAMVLLILTLANSSERVIDPMRMLIVDGRAYLEAWCRRAEAVRMFRLDRIDELTEREPPVHVGSSAIFTPAPPVTTTRTSSAAAATRRSPAA